MRTETVDKISVKYGVQSAVNSLEIPYKTEDFREKGVNDKQDKSIIHLPRQSVADESENQYLQWFQPSEQMNFPHFSHNNEPLA